MSRRQRPSPTVVGLPGRFRRSLIPSSPRSSAPRTPTAQISPEAPRTTPNLATNRPRTARRGMQRPDRHGSAPDLNVQVRGHSLPSGGRSRIRTWVAFATDLQNAPTIAMTCGFPLPRVIWSRIGRGPPSSTGHGWASLGLPGPPSGPHELRSGARRRGRVGAGVVDVPDDQERPGAPQRATPTPRAWSLPGTHGCPLTSASALAIGSI
jgi:hypothetical protein